jgi:hypothetical protein
MEEGQGPTDVASWIVVSAVMSTLATYGTVASRRLWRKEIQVELEPRPAQAVQDRRTLN